jgi:outer membrane protein OmpA-like peptidoglycan-associated protein
MLLLDYARNPLVLSSSDERVGAVVSDQLLMHVGASLTLADRYLLSLNIPFAIAQSGDDPSDASSGLAARSPEGADLGDIRLGARARVLGPAGPGVQLAVGGHLWLPSGASDAYLSDGSVRGSPFLVVGGEHGRVYWSSQAGVMLRPGKTLPGTSSTPIGTAITFGAALGVLVDRERTVALGPELYGQHIATDDAELFDAHSVNAEVLLGARYRPGRGAWVLGAGAGPGIGRAAGTPDYRLLAMVAYSPEDREAKATDSDGDGIIDTEDSCSHTPGVRTRDPKTHGCPAPRDRDGDSVVDAVDACPDERGIATSDAATHGCPADADRDGIVDSADACRDVAGVASDDPKTNGCPADRDSDGVPDVEDACADVSGVRSQDPKAHGCPPDRDGDRVLDATDACVDVPGIAHDDPKKNGCPRVQINVDEKLITISEQVHFEHGKAILKPESFALLEDVARVLKDHAELELIEVQGHTDNTGRAALNRRLSADRATAVVRWLVEHGIDQGRLKSRGFGPDKPVGDNKTEQGRAQNRRVEFHVLRGLGGGAVQERGVR